MIQVGSDNDFAVGGFTRSRSNYNQTPQATSVISYLEQAMLVQSTSTDHENLVISSMKDKKAVCFHQKCKLWLYNKPTAKDCQNAWYQSMDYIQFRKHTAKLVWALFKECSMPQDHSSFGNEELRCCIGLDTFHSKRSQISQLRCALVRELSCGMHKSSTMKMAGTLIWLLQGVRKYLKEARKTPFWWPASWPHKSHCTTLLPLPFSYNRKASPKRGNMYHLLCGVRTKLICSIRILIIRARKNLCVSDGLREQSN